MSGTQGPALAAHTVAIPLHQPSGENTNFATFGPKDPGDVLPYKIDATAFLNDAGATFVGTPAIVPNSTDITISDIEVVGSAVTFLVAGGNANTKYGIAFDASLTNSENLSRQFWIPVAPLNATGNTPMTVVAMGAPGIVTPAELQTIADQAAAAATTTAAAEEASALGSLTGSLTTLTAEVQASTTAVSGEATRAEAAEAENATAISGEAARAETAEAAAETATANEATRAKAAEGSIGSTVSTLGSEMAAVEAELDIGSTTNGTLSAAITSEQARAETAETANANSVAGERARAEAAEASLAGSINVQAGEISANAGAISTEQARAESAEATDAAAVTSEKTRAEAAEGSVAGSVTTLESSVGTQATEISSLETNLAGETARAEAAEAADAGAVSTERGRAESAEEAGTAAVAAEQNRAETSESSLAGSLSALESTVGTQATELAFQAGEIAAETGRAEAAEGVAEAAVQTEESRAKAAEQAITVTQANDESVAAGQAQTIGQIEAAANAETQRAEAAEASDLAQVQGERERAEAAEAALGQATSASSTAAISAETTRAEAAEGAETTRAETAEAADAAATSAEVTRAEGAEAANATAIGNEVARAEGAEAANSAATGSEVTRAEAAESANAIAIATETTRAKAAEGIIAAAAQAAQTLAAACVLAASLGSSPISFNTVGGLSVDNPQIAGATQTVAQIAQRAGTVLEAQAIANNANLVPSTAGMFWTAADAAAYQGPQGQPGVVNVPALMQAAISWSAANLRPVYFPPGIYAMGSTRITITQNRVHLIFHRAAFVTYSLTNPATSMFTIAGNDITIEGGIIGAPNDTYIDWYTGLPLSFPDLNDWRTVCAGNWAGLTNYGALQTSATQLFQNATNTVYCDALPAGYTQATLQAQLAAGPIYLNHNQYLNYGSSIASFAQVTIGSWTGWAFTLNPPAGQTYAVRMTSQGIIPAIIRASETSATAYVIERAAISAPSLVMLSGPPVFYTGGAFNYTGAGFTLLGVEFRNCKGGRQVIGGGDRFLAVNCRGLATDGNTGSCIIHFNGGFAPMWVGGVINSGDQGAQFVVGGIFKNGAFQSGSNHNIVGGRYLGARIISLSAQAISFGLDIPNYNQAVPWVSGATTNIPVGNSITLPGPIPAGLTLAMLQQSGPAYFSGAVYQPGALAVNSGNLYVTTQGGATNPNGNGPSGTGSNIVDGSCTWAYVSPGMPLYLSWPHKFLQVGVVVSGVVVNGDGSVTMGLVPPTGSASAIKAAVTTQTTFEFISGAPLGALSAGIIDCAVESCYCYCPGGQGLTMGNTDSVGVLDGAVLNCTFDCTFATGIGAATTTPTFAISGGAYGGARVRIEGNHIIAPPNAAVHANGNLFDMRMNGNTFESPTTQQDGYPHISLGGVQGGSFSRNVVWCSATKTTLALGSSSGFDLLNQPLIGTTSFFDVDHNIFRGAADGIPVISLSSGQNRNITYNRVFQASPLGAGNAIFIESMNGSGGGDQADWNDTSQIDGSPYTAQSGNAPAVLIGSFERFNPAPAGAGAVLPVITVPPALAASIAAQIAAAVRPVPLRIASLLAQSAATINPFTGFLLRANCTQLGVVPAAQITVPAGAFDAQLILITTCSTITNLTLVGAPTNLPAGGTQLLKATGLLLSWDAFLGQWDVANLTPSALANMNAPSSTGLLGVSGGQLVVGN